jgi:beta-1,4-mannosyl-glycoprotein beta-1,4-N-acetylglucosaminyltransferase
MGDQKDCLAHTYFHPKVRTVMIDLPLESTPWERDVFQKNAKVDLASFGIVDDDNDDAIIMMSDVDEVPDPRIIDALRDNFNDDVLYVLHQRMFQCYLNVVNRSQPWAGTRLCSSKMYEQLDVTVHEQRGTPLTHISHAGWHWSFIGGSDVIKEKLRSFSHPEYNTEEVHNQIETRMRDGKDVIGRQFLLQQVEIDESFPSYIVNNVALLEKSGLIKSP